MTPIATPRCCQAEATRPAATQILDAKTIHPLAVKPSKTACVLKMTVARSFGLLYTASRYTYDIIMLLLVLRSCGCDGESYQICIFWNELDSRHDVIVNNDKNIPFRLQIEETCIQIRAKRTSQQRIELNREPRALMLHQHCRHLL